MWKITCSLGPFHGNISKSGWGWTGMALKMYQFPWGFDTVWDFSNGGSWSHTCLGMGRPTGVCQSHCSVGNNLRMSDHPYQPVCPGLISITTTTKPTMQHSYTTSHTPEDRQVTIRQSDIHPHSWWAYTSPSFGSFNSDHCTKHPRPTYTCNVLVRKLQWMCCLYVLGKMPRKHL
jgi:hypothetical protein